MVHASEHLVEDHAERPGVRSRIDLAARNDLLRRFVIGGVDRERGHGHPLVLLRPCSVDAAGGAEVQDFDQHPIVGLLGAEDVRRAEIAVHDATDVRARERFAGLEDDVHSLIDGERATAGDPLAERLTREALDDDVGAIIREVPDVEVADDVGAADGGRLSRRAAELRCEARIPLVRVQDFDDDWLAEREVCGRHDECAVTFSENAPKPVTFHRGLATSSHDEPIFCSSLRKSTNVVGEGAFG